MNELFDRYRLDLPDAEIEVWPSFYSLARADELLDLLEHEIAWRHDSITVYGRTSPIPRLNAWYGDPGCSYRYSNISLDPLPWTPTLATVRDDVASVGEAAFNSVLANLYRDGSDGVAWHADDEPALGDEPVIASVSFGATRTLQLRRRDDPNVRHTIALAHGDLIVMRGPTQRNWLHQIPKTAKPVARRLNLTFRQVFAF
jgi:alkylated DNA repair dioxygenase AlkB